MKKGTSLVDSDFERLVGNCVEGFVLIFRGLGEGEEFGIGHDVVSQ